MNARNTLVGTSTAGSARTPAADACKPASRSDAPWRTDTRALREPGPIHEARTALHRTPQLTVFAMEDRFDVVTGVVAVCVAGYAAIMLDYVVHDDLGFSIAQIRHGAVIAALFLAVPLALDLLRAKANKI